MISHGAFAGCERSPERVRVNMNHCPENVVGKAVALDPWHETGLVGTIRISRTRLGDEALALAGDGVLDASAEVTVPAGGDEWRGSSARRIRKATLRGIGLTSQPAYEAAQVVAVRGRELLAAR